MKALVAQSFRYASGRVAAGTPVSVVLRGTDTPAELFSAGDRAVPIANPVTTSQTGSLAFYVETGAYDFLVGGIRTPVDAVSSEQEAIDAAVAELRGGTPPDADTLSELLAKLQQRPLKVAGITPDANGDVPASSVADAVRPTLTATFARLPIAPLEAVPLTIYGDSYGQGTQGADQASRPFNRIANRHRTQAATVQAVAGTRMDEIAAKVASTWSPNGRGLVGFADGCINDVKQYGDNTGLATTREAFRTSLAYLTSRAVNGIATPAFSFGAGWTNGTSSTAAAAFNFAFKSATAYLLVNFVTGAGGSLTIKDAGTTVATVTTGGYKQNFTGAIKLTGSEATTKQLTATLDSGTATVVGLAVTSPTPPVIAWDKPGQYNASTTEYTRLQAYLAECAGILGDFPTVVQCPMGSGWDYPTMVSEDTTHRNDLGNRYATGKIEDALTAFLTSERQGLNRLTASGSTAAYVPQTATTAPGAATILVADSFNRADATTLGTTETGAKVWTVPGGTSTTQIVSNQAKCTAVTPGSANGGAVVDAAVSDGTIKATLSILSTHGISYRRATATTATGYIAWRNGSNYTISKQTGLNAFTALASSAGVTPAANDVLEVVLNGASMKLRVNGVEVISTTDSTYTGTFHGYWSSAANSIVDDFSITDAVA